MNTKTKNRRAVTSIGVVAIAALMIVSVAAYDFADAAKPGSGGGDSTQGADKTMIAGTTTTYVLDTYNWSPVVFGLIKTSNTGDLIVSYNEECAIHTGLKLTDSYELATSAVRQDVRLVVGGTVDPITNLPIVDANGDIIDGKVIPAVYGDVSDPPNPEYDGIITMCGRAYQIDTNLLSTVAELCAQHNPNPDGTPSDVCTADGLTGDVKEIFFNSFIRTKQAHSWDWVALDMGSGDHLVTVQSRIYYSLAGLNSGSDSATAEADASTFESCLKEEIDGTFTSLTRNCVDSILEVGKRGLIVQVDKLPVGTTYG